MNQIDRIARMIEQEPDPIIRAAMRDVLRMTLDKLSKWEGEQRT